MKMELRCHAVLCTSEAKAKAMALRLHEKLSSSLKEFLREKLRKQTSRLALERTSSLPKTGAVLPLRTQLLSTASNFRGTPTSKNNAANKLGAITEDSEEEEMMRVLEEEEEVEENEEEVGDILVMRKKFLLMKRASAGGRLVDSDNNNSSNTNNNVTRQGESESLPATPCSSGPRTVGLVHNGEEHHGILQALDLDASSSTSQHHLIDHTGAAVDAVDSALPSSSSSAKDGSGAHVLREYMTSDQVINLEIGNDLDELRRDDQVQYCLNNELEGHDSDEESAESGFHDQEASNPDQDIADSERALSHDGQEEVDESEDIDELTVCPFPSLEDTAVMRNPSSEKTSL